jgi:hypothetical protein
MKTSVIRVWGDSASASEKKYPQQLNIEQRHDTFITLLKISGTFKAFLVVGKNQVFLCVYEIIHLL